MGNKIGKTTQSVFQWQKKENLEKKTKGGLPE